MKTLWFFAVLALATLSVIAQENNVVDYLIIKQQFSDGSKDTIVTANKFSQQLKLVASDTATIKVEDGVCLFDYDDVDNIILLADQLTTNSVKATVAKDISINKIYFIFKGIMPYEWQEVLVKTLLASRQHGTIYLTEQCSPEVTVRFSWLAFISWVLLLLSLILLIYSSKVATVVITAAISFGIGITVVLAAVVVAINPTITGAVVALIATVALVVTIVTAFIATGSIVVNSKIKIAKILTSISLSLLIISWVIIFMQ